MVKIEIIIILLINHCKYGSFGFFFNSIICLNFRVKIQIVSEPNINIKHIKNPSEAVCLAAVKQNGWAIQYIDEPSEAVCLAAVQENGLALQYIKKQTEKLCRIALKQDKKIIKFVDEEFLSLFLKNIL